MTKRIKSVMGITAERALLEIEHNHLATPQATSKYRNVEDTTALAFAVRKGMNAGVCMTEGQRDLVRLRILDATVPMEQARDSITDSINGYRLDCENCLTTKEDCEDRSPDVPIGNIVKAKDPSGNVELGGTPRLDVDTKVGLQEFLAAMDCPKHVRNRIENAFNAAEIRKVSDFSSELGLSKLKNFGPACLKAVKGALDMHGIDLPYRRDSGSVESQNTQNPKNIGVDDINFSTRTRAMLSNVEIQTLGDACRFSEADLIKVDNFSKKSLKELKSVLFNHGLKLKKNHQNNPESDGAHDSILMSESRLPQCFIEAHDGLKKKLQINLDFRNSFSRPFITTLGDFRSYTRRDLSRILREFGNQHQLGNIEEDVDEIVAALAGYNIELLS